MLPRLLSVERPSPIKGPYGTTTEILLCRGLTLNENYTQLHRGMGGFWGRSTHAHTHTRRCLPFLEQHRHPALLLCVLQHWA